MKIILLSILMAVSSSTLANSMVNTTSTIDAIYTYAYRGNEIAIRVATPIPGACSAGFWLDTTDSENNKNFSAFLLSAFHSGANVYFNADSDDSWSGSTLGAYCKIHALGLVK